MKLTTFETPDGPFTLLAEWGVVLASGWTDDPEALLGRLRSAERPAPVAVADGSDPELAAPTAAVVAYYAGDPRPVNEVPVRQAGTAWRQRGWSRLRRIEAGSTISYRQLATDLGSPNAVRAAASICAGNAPALFVPCHRVVRSDGSLGGFAWGEQLKAALLRREASG